MSNLIFKCEVCNKEYISRNQLFIHLKDTNHLSINNRRLDSPLNYNTLIDDISHNKKLCIEDISIKFYDNDLNKKIINIDEDEWYRVIIKPQGLATMGIKGITLMKAPEMLLPNAMELKLSYKKAYPCHRLDQGTGGLMLCSKSKLAERIIMTCFKQKLIRKRYRAIVYGKVEAKIGRIDSLIDSKEALTIYSVSEYTISKDYEYITTIDLWPITGRKHQLRKHLQSIGHSIVGDSRYSSNHNWSNKNLPMFLWALEIEFPHPQYCIHLVSTDVNNTILNNINIDKNKISNNNSKEKLVSENYNIYKKKSFYDPPFTGGNNIQFIINSSCSINDNIIQCDVKMNDEEYKIVYAIDEPLYYKDFRINQLISKA